jgi:hypothetical protein
MKKGLKISLPIFLLLVILLGIFAITIYQSSKNIDYEIGETVVQSNIEQILLLDFEGFIVCETPLVIDNGGLYAIRDLTITIDVYGQDFTITDLNGLLLGHGENSIGDILAKDVWSGSVGVNLTENIPILAIQDGTLQIEISISLKLDFIVYKYEYVTLEEQLELWDSPFGF